MSSSLLSLAPKQASSRPVTIVAHAAFIPTGVVTVLLGPLLPILSSRWALSDAQAGYLFTAQFAASMIGVALFGWLAASFAFRLPIVAGVLMMALGTITLPAAGWPFGLACVACWGVGLGLTIPAANLVVAEVNQERRTGALNLLNFSWSLGAVACPLLVAVFQRTHRTSLFLYSLSGVLVFVSVVISATSFPSTRREPLAEPTDLRPVMKFLRARDLVLFGTLFFLYVGMENAIGGWSASYAKRVSVQPDVRSVMTPSFFYGALLLGRGLGPLLLRHIPELRMAQIGSLIGCLGTVALLCSHTIATIGGSVIATGLGLSTLYPITIAALSRRFGSTAARLGSLMFSLGNVGGATLPYLVGYFSKQLGSLNIGLAVPLIAGVIMFGLFTRLTTENSPPV
jgi:MFS transporter, FHS family, glucose/mannose:H+ symporter